MKVYREWVYADMAEVEILDDWSGIRFRSRDGVEDAWVFTFPPATTQRWASAEALRVMLLIKASHMIVTGGDYAAWAQGLDMTVD